MGAEGDWEMSQPVETIVVEDAATVGCDGGGGQLGHPLVYLVMGKEGSVSCPYCGRLYVLSENADISGHGH